MKTTFGIKIQVDKIMMSVEVQAKDNLISEIVELEVEAKEMEALFKEIDIDKFPLF